MLKSGPRREVEHPNSPLCVCHCEYINIQILIILLTFSCNGNYDLLYMAHQFLVYTCQVYFGYKLNDFLHLPPSDQIVERGFYLLERWWCPTADAPYSNISKLFTSRKLFNTH